MSVLHVVPALSVELLKHVLTGDILEVNREGTMSERREAANSCPALLYIVDGSNFIPFNLRLPEECSVITKYDPKHFIKPTICQHSPVHSTFSWDVEYSVPVNLTDLRKMLNKEFSEKDVSVDTRNMWISDMAYTDVQLNGCTYVFFVDVVVDEDDGEVNDEADEETEVELNTDKNKLVEILNRNSTEYFNFTEEYGVYYFGYTPKVEGEEGEGA